MKTYDERKQRVKVYMRRARARRIVWNCVKTTASMACLVAIIVGLLHIPYGQQNTSVIPTEYSSNPSQTPSTGVPTEPTVPSGPELPPDDSTPNDPTVPTEPVEVIDVTICMPDEGMARLTMQQIDRFNLINTLGVVINATFTWESEADTADIVAQDPQNAPDLFCFRQENLMRLVNVGALMPLSDGDSQWVLENNLTFTCDTVCYNEAMYAFPMAYRYAQLLYYDRSVVSDEDAKSLSKIIAACEAAGKKFCFETTDVYNYFSFFLATGCNSVWYRDAEGNPMDVVDNLNSPEGIIALRGMMELLNSPVRTTTLIKDMSSTAIMQDVYAECGAIIVGGGLYGAAIYEEIIGENTGIAMLPTFCVDGIEYQLNTFADCNMMGMKPQEDAKKAMILSELAKFLCGEECQYERFDRIYYMVPSNLAALERAKEKEAYISPLVEQSEFAVPKMLIPGTAWWGYTRDIIHSVAEGVDPEVSLEYYEQRLHDMLNPTTATWSVIGTMNNSQWCVDYEMYEESPGVFRTKNYLHFEEDTEFKIRYGGSWDVYLGGDGMNVDSSIRPGLTGDYYVIFYTETLSWGMTLAVSW